jgi:hypothetical protein
MGTIRVKAIGFELVSLNNTTFKPGSEQANSALVVIF